MKPHPEQKEHSTITVDVVVMRIVYEGPYQEIDLQMAVIKRPKSPYKDFWVLPGGHLNVGESFGDAARREWSEETHAEPVDLEPIGVFGEPGRDERGRYVSFLFFGMASSDTELFMSDSASEARWVSAFNSPSLGFDHDRMQTHALNHLYHKLMLIDTALKVLPEEVSLHDLRSLLEQLKLLFASPNAPVESVGGQQESCVPFLFG